ncbi:MAG: PCRF domain-containing protein, partial [Alphaproteobacteria bacterium]|nr:PCRF domain-containing protein [Alphaproteobacteria bacterium]
MERSLEVHLEQLTRRHLELREALTESGLSGSEFARLSKEYSELSPIVEDIDALRRARVEASSLADMADSSEDADLQQLAEQELHELRQRLPGLEQRVKFALLPKD